MENNGNKISISKIILWALFLPIMGSIAIWKSSKLSTVIKILLIFVIWCFVFGVMGSDTSKEQQPDTPPVTTTEASSSNNKPSQTTNKETTTTPEVKTTHVATTKPNQTQPAETERNERKVYITPTGKKYHYSKSCY